MEWKTLSWWNKSPTVTFTFSNFYRKCVSYGLIWWKDFQPCKVISTPRYHQWSKKLVIYLCHEKKWGFTEGCFFSSLLLLLLERFKWYIVRSYVSRGEGVRLEARLILKYGLIQGSLKAASSLFPTLPSIFIFITSKAVQPEIVPLARGLKRVNKL